MCGTNASYIFLSVLHAVPIAVRCGTRLQRLAVAVVKANKESYYMNEVDLPLR